MFSPVRSWCQYKNIKTNTKKLEASRGGESTVCSRVPSRGEAVGREVEWKYLVLPPRPRKFSKLTGRRREALS